MSVPVMCNLNPCCKVLCWSPGNAHEGLGVPGVCARTRQLMKKALSCTAEPILCVDGGCEGFEF